MRPVLFRLWGRDVPTHGFFVGLGGELAARPICADPARHQRRATARSDALLGLLSEHGERVEVYLQFDGLRAGTVRHHRDADVQGLERESARRLSERQIFTTLVMTAALGVNDDEIGDVVRVALDTPYVGGVCIQPPFPSGRSGSLDPLDRLTHTGVLARLGPQTDGLLTWRDLTAPPGSHPHCYSVG